MSLSDKLRNLRINMGIGQLDVADELGVSRSCYSNYEQGRREPTIDILKEICIIYDITLDELLDFDVKKERKNHKFRNKDFINR